MPTYDIALSFAGEDRAKAQELASALVTRGLKVFFDEYEQANLWGKDLYSHLSKVYKDEAKFYVMLLSQSYTQKQWTTHERRAAQARAFVENQEYILPLRIDDTEVDGILGTTGFLDARKLSTERIVDAVVAKIRSYNADHGIVAATVSVADVLARQNIRLRGGQAIEDSDIRTVCPACETSQLLSEAPLSLDGEETCYFCKNGCQPLVVVGRPGIVAWEGRGYRLGEFVIRNVRDLIVGTADMAVPMVLSARTAALMKKRPSATT
jgi:hypothetical protein